MSNLVICISLNFLSGYFSSEEKSNYSHGRWSITFPRILKEMFKDGISTRSLLINLQLSPFSLQLSTQKGFSFENDFFQHHRHETRQMANGIMTYASEIGLYKVSLYLAMKMSLWPSETRRERKLSCMKSLKSNRHAKPIMFTWKSFFEMWNQ